MINEIKSKKSNKLDNKRIKKIKTLIQYILNLKRKKIKENNNNEKPEIKLARRIEQRSNKNLTEKIALYLIIRYEIDNNKLPKIDELIQNMIEFLGNIQKSPQFYNLNYTKKEISFKVNEIIGNGSQGTIYSFNLKTNKQTKKPSKKLAVKLQKFKDPYPINIHITSAILLALYGFQPKYYNNYFMEIGSYPYKSDEREFHTLTGNLYKKNIIKKNIKWFILYNFTNIADQTYNFMKREKNGELVKIDIKHLNSETREVNINDNLIYFNKYEDIFKENKDIVFKELNKLFNIKEDFLIDLIKFRTERGCYNISNKILKKEIKCLSSCYKVIKINEKSSFIQILFSSRKNYNGYNLSFNPAMSWMLYILFQKNILNEIQYNECINKFNEMSIKYEKLANNIDNKEIFFEKSQKYEIIKIEKKHKKRSKTNDYRYNNKYSNLNDYTIYYINQRNKNDEKIENKNIKENNINNVESENITLETKIKSQNNIFKISNESENINNIDTQGENISEQNKKQTNRIFGFCCGEDAIDVID